MLRWVEVLADLGGHNTALRFKSPLALGF